MSEAWHWEYTTRSAFVRDGTPWPMREPNALIKGTWQDDQKLIAMGPWHSQYSSGFEIWWIERVKVADVPPVQPDLTEYEKLRKELQR